MIFDKEKQQEKLDKRAAALRANLQKRKPIVKKTQATQNQPTKDKP